MKNIKKLIACCCIFIAISEQIYSAEAKIKTEQTYPQESWSRHLLNSAQMNSYSEVKRALENGADVNYQNAYGFSALHFALHNKNFNKYWDKQSMTSIINILEAYNINKTLKDEDGLLAGQHKLYDNESFLPEKIQPFNTEQSRFNYVETKIQNESEKSSPSISPIIMSPTLAAWLQSSN